MAAGTLAGRLILILAVALLAAQVASLMLHLKDLDALMAAGLPRSGVPGLEAVPMRFLWHAGLTFAVVIGVSLIAVRWIARPLREMADAATAFAHDIDAPPLPASGPAEVRRAAEAFNFMQQRLRQLVVERSRALAAVSHDLRTPLTRMRLRAEMIDDPALQQKLDADIDTMQAMVDSVLAYLRGIEDAEKAQPINIEALLESIVDDERSLGRPVAWVEGEAGAEMTTPSSLCAATPHPAPRDQPAAVLRPAALCSRPHGPRRGPCVAPGAQAPWGGPASPEPVLPYTGRLSVLRRAIGNLVDNAVAHGGKVGVRLHDAPGELRIVVEDDGPGIAPADLARATEPYVRLDAARSLAGGGVGLGLAIVRDAAASHGGRLVLENRSEGGLRASLVLPRAA
ncbi:MAG: HAMP domain-containing protein [Ideonella sp.]|nr:HAMP domain-containing protein [Ideonella sp.]